MKASKFTEAQKAFILKQGEEGTQVAEICRKAGISQATCFNWKKRYGGLLPDEMRRLKALEDEKGGLKKIVADLTLDREMLQDVIRRKLQGLLGSASLSTRCWGTGAYRSAGRVRPCGSTLRATIINHVAPANSVSPSSASPNALKAGESFGVRKPLFRSYFSG